MPKPVLVKSGDGSLIYIRPDAVSWVQMTELKPQTDPPGLDKFQVCVHFIGEKFPIHLQFRDEQSASTLLLKLLGDWQ